MVRRVRAVARRWVCRLVRGWVPDLHRVLVDGRTRKQYLDVLRRHVLVVPTPLKVQLQLRKTILKHQQLSMQPLRQRRHRADHPAGF
jgi:hypothetical protein